MSLVTLVTDFGSSDFYAPLLKAAIVSSSPHVNLLDITHDISSQDIMEGAFFLKCIQGRFPSKTIHVALVNTYYRRDFQLISFVRENQFFIGPNNGIFSLLFPELDHQGVFQLSDLDELGVYKTVGSAIHLLFNEDDVSKLGSPLEKLEKKIQLQPVITSNQIRATIIYIDHFGNVIVNLDKETFERVRNGREYAIYYKGNDPIKKLSRGYHEVGLTEVCAFFNEVELLEIAVNMGNATELLNLNKNETIQINFY